ncbi:hypothetical protein BTA37_22230 [Priestia megaterium]|nr:hypothetical protein BTA37_22230 [Priestia megaterium]
MIKRKETLSLDRSDKLSVQALLALVESFTTLELKINFTNSVWNARLQMIGQGIKQSSTDR